MLSEKCQRILQLLQFYVDSKSFQEMRIYIIGKCFQNLNAVVVNKVSKAAGLVDSVIIHVSVTFLPNSY